MYALFYICLIIVFIIILYIHIRISMHIHRNTENFININNVDLIGIENANKTKTPEIEIHIDESKYNNFIKMQNKMNKDIIDKINRLNNENNILLNNMNTTSDSTISPADFKLMKKMSTESDKNTDNKLYNYASMCLVDQSSTINNNIAKYAIDNNMNTYNQTDMELAWLKLTLPDMVEIDNIVIYNRKETNTIKSRIVPSTLSIYDNDNNKTYEYKISEVNDIYRINNIYVVGKVIKLQLENINYLHILNIEIWGKKSQSCEYYKQKMINSTNKDKYMSLYKSCNILNENKSAKTENANANDLDVMNNLAVAYDDIVKSKQEKYNKERDNALIQLKEIEKQKILEEQVERSAKLYGLPAPPPKYTQSEIDKYTKASIPYKRKNLTERQKADCMILINNISIANDKAQELGRLSEKMTYLIPSAKKASTDYENLQKKYDMTC